MDLDALDRVLSSSAGTLSLPTTSFPGTPWESLLVLCNGNQPLVVERARKTRTARGFTVTGTASFLNVPALAVRASFSLDRAGAPVAVVRFGLVTGLSNPNRWRFSTSFPNLPALEVSSQSNVLPGGHLLDQLALSNARFILTTHAGKDDATGAPLEVGLNFIARFDPRGALGLFDRVLGGAARATVYGPIRMPSPTTRTPMLPVAVFPWQLDRIGPVPGIHLRADLGISLAVGELSLQRTALSIYCPTSTTWCAANPSYQPMAAVTGRLALGASGLAADAAAFYDGGQVSLFASFEGARLDGLARLGALGGDEVLDLVPPMLADVIRGAGRLELVRVGLAFAGGLTPRSVASALVTIGMPDASWTLFDGMTVAGPLLDVTVLSPFTARRKVIAAVRGTLELGGAKLGLFSQAPDFTIRADLADGATLPLAALFERHLPELPAPPDLDVAELQLVIAPGRSYSLFAALGGEKPWRIDLGPLELAFESVRLSLAKEAGAPAQGGFSGALRIGDVHVEAAYDLPGDFFVRTQLPKISLSWLVGTFDELGLELPAGLAPELDQAYVILAKQGPGFTFTAATAVSGLGLLAFTASRRGGKTGVAIGVALDAPSIGAVPGLEPLGVLDELVGLQRLMLVVSSLDDPGFQFPDMAAFQAPPLAGKQVRLPAGGGIARGVNLYASLAGAKSQGLQALARLLGLQLDGSVTIALAVSLPNPLQSSRLFLRVDQELQPGTRLTGALGIQLQGGSPGVFLTGELRTSIQGQPLLFAATAVVAANGVLISGSMTGGSIRLDPLPVALSNLGLAIGVTWQGIPSFGIAATLDVQSFQSSVAVFYDSVDPAKSMLAGAIDGLSLRDIAAVLAGQLALPPAIDRILARFALRPLAGFTAPASLAAALDGRDLPAIAAAFQQHGGVALTGTSDGISLTTGHPGQGWHVTDMTTMMHYRLLARPDGIAVELSPQLYVAPQDTHLGSLRFPQGMHVEAEIDLLIASARIRVLVSPSRGIAADIDVDPIVIYRPSFFRLAAAEGPGGPRLSLSSYDQPAHPVPELRAPHLLINGTLVLLGQTLSSVYVSLTASGARIQISQRTGVGLRVDLAGRIDGLDQLQVSGGAVIGIDRPLDLGPLGTLDLRFDVNGSLEIGYAGGTARASFRGGFDVFSVHAEIPTLSLDVDGPGLANLAETVWGQVRDIVGKLLADADRWLSWLAGGAIRLADQAAEAVGRVLRDIYRLGSDAIAAKTKAILGYGADQAARALSGAGYAAEEAGRALAGAGYAVADTAKAIGSVFRGHHVDTRLGHVDTPRTHVDTSGFHTDVPRTHVDHAQHTDVGGNHVDRGVWRAHVDKRIPHGDARPHVDRTTTPHVDTRTPHTDVGTPHADTGTHLDTRT